MPTAAINQHGCRISLKSERLEVFGRNEATQRDEVLREIPIRDLDRLIIAESVQITSQALAALLRASIPVSILGCSGQFLGGFLPAQNDHGLARLRQYQCTLDPLFGLQMAGRIVTAKLYNQRRVLQRLTASRIADCGLRIEGQSTPEPAQPAGPQSATPAHESPSPNPQSAIPAPQSAIRNPQSALDWLDALFAPISRSQSLDELRGYEGASTARYFQAWGAFLPEQFPFERRSTRPPLNPVNACISFGATLLYSEAVAFLHAHGLDPALGLLHSTEDGRWSLALDLLEPFRPVLVEALALDLFSHQILNADQFEPRNGGTYLNEEGRKKFFLQYERRMERQFLSEAAGHRTTLRQQLEHQAVMYKAALEDAAKFQPFLMN
jgi:CRISPR-associated protein Cas1